MNAREFAIVTGAGSGIGRAVAIALSEEPVGVLAVGRRGDALRDTLARASAEIVPIVADVATRAGRRRITTVLGADDRVRYLIHAAGIHPVEPLVAVTPASWRQTLAINLDARLFLTLELLPWFGADSRILFVGSNSATRARKSGTAYCVTQAATFMLQECLKLELAERGIAVSSAIPSPAATPMLDAQIEADASIYPDAEEYRRLRDQGRVIAPATVARFYRWLLTDLPAAEFSARQWNVRDASHHTHWLGDGNLYAAQPSR